MSLPTARARIMDLLDGAAYCLLNEKALPATCLCMVAVDTMASLSRPTNTDRVTRQHFVAFIEKYVLPQRHLPCTALEIYALRCGLLHAQSPRSELGEAGKVRDIWFGYGSTDLDQLQAAADRSHRSGSVVVVSLTDLLQAITDGTASFGAHLERDAALRSLVEQRSDRLYATMETGP